MRTKVRLGDVANGLTKYCPQRASVDARMCGNGESLTSTFVKSAQLYVAATASFYDKSELVENRE
ncbi:MAG TPA: hypothetical protein VN742_11435 [Candidatus Binataceae bacterium]|nr:hypothetical protein [Candidatus Binataceae bacterium]